MSLEYTYRVLPVEAFASGAPETSGVAPGDRQFTLLLGADYALHQVFARLGGPLRFAIAGDHCPDGSYENPTGPDPVFMAYVTPATVREVNAALVKLPRWRVIELLRALDRTLVQHKEGRDRYSDAYDTVQAAYASAAKQGAGLRILIC